MRKTRERATHLISISVALIVLGSLTALPILPTRTATAATNGTLTRLADQPASTVRANGKIAFVGHRDGNDEIYTINADGSDLQRLTSNPNDSTDDPRWSDSPVWSPDGRHILFQRAHTIYFPLPSRQIVDTCVMNADGSNQTLLVSSGDNGDYVRLPVWSPDSSKLVFVQGVLRGTGTSRVNEIIVMSPDGSNRMRVAQFNSISGVNWSRDGAELAFSTPDHTYVMNADGTNSRIVSQGFPPLYAFSPEGSKLAVECGGICLANIDGTNSIQITHPSSDGYVDASDTDPHWSPDGSKIVFARIYSDGYDSYGGEARVVNTDGSNERHAGTNVSSPQWSPDGTKIVFTDGPDYRYLGVYVMNAATGSVTKIGDGRLPSWQAVPYTPGAIDDAQFFVRQHYSDFLNRDPDADGLAYWSNEIALCGSDQECIAAKRINVSAAFFLSIEFQETGYLVYRVYKSSYGDLAGAPVPLTLGEFLPDTRAVSQGVIVNQTGWEQVLENNKQAFATEFVQRTRFTSLYPTSSTPDQFVDQLFLNAGVTPSSTDRAAAINEFGGAGTSADTAARARALRRVAENSTLKQQEFNRAFVLMQYFGYLRRNPIDAPEPGLNYDGYNFWLNKLNTFNGDFVRADMVKAFINSTEYRQRFGL